MKKIIYPCFLILLSSSCIFANELPSDAKWLTAKRAEAIEKIDRTYVKELEKLKVKYTKKGDLDSANAIVALMEDKSIPFRQKSSASSKLFDEIVNTGWKYYHPGGNNGFVLERSGTLEAERWWGICKWRVISDSEILIEHPKGERKMIMTFSEDFDSFRGYHWDGTPVTGSRSLSK